MPKYLSALKINLQIKPADFALRFRGAIFVCYSCYSSNSPTVPTVLQSLQKRQSCGHKGRCRHGNGCRVGGALVCLRFGAVWRCSKLGLVSVLAVLRFLGLRFWLWFALVVWGLFSRVVRVCVFGGVIIPLARFVRLWAEF